MVENSEIRRRLSTSRVIKGFVRSVEMRASRVWTCRCFLLPRSISRRGPSRASMRSYFRYLRDRERSVSAARAVTGNHVNIRNAERFQRPVPSFRTARRFVRSHVRPENCANYDRELRVPLRNEAQPCANFSKEKERIFVTTQLSNALASVESLTISGSNFSWRKFVSLHNLPLKVHPMAPRDTLYKD